AYYGEEKAKRMRSEIKKLLSLQTNESLKGIYEKLKDHPLIQWKWHIKKAVGLPQPAGPEQWPEGPIPEAPIN
ncbi:MAG: hypothetical protein P4M12_05565, partial [Gammaproteobacteria bacterium]|nr:hypothetical protein [Gammaproteobacteria bacterium]